MVSGTPPKLLRAVFGREANTYAGSDIEMARRFARVLWPSGLVVMLLMLPFFPPVRTAWGWPVVAFVVVATLGAAVAACIRPERISYDALYYSGYWALANLTLLEWLGGGRRAPYHELFLLLIIASALQHPPRRFTISLAFVYAAAFAPALYGGADGQVGQIATELTLWTGIGVFLVIFMRRIRAQRVAAHELARVDALTGLGNRRAFDEALEDALSRARRTGARVTVLVTDLNDFKRINDVHGHVAGDECIRQAADALRATVRDGEGCFRWGGDEFAVLVPDVAAGAAATLAARVEAAVSDTARTPEGAPLTLACGYAEVGGEYTPAEAVAAADDVLRSLKSREPVA